MEAVILSSNYSFIKRAGTEEFYLIMTDNYFVSIKHEMDKRNYQNMGTTVEYKNWKTKYVGLLQSAQLNVNTCKAIIQKHTYLNRLGQKMYDSTTFTQQERTTFNKNLDSLSSKLGQISDLEYQSNFYSYYNEKATINESAVSFNLSTFYNTTGRS